MLNYIQRSVYMYIVIFTTDRKWLLFGLEQYTNTIPIKVLYSQVSVSENPVEGLIKGT